jgi:hypothetical protein
VRLDFFAGKFKALEAIMNFFLRNAVLDGAFPAFFSLKTGF